MEEKNGEGGFISPECFRAYVNAEIMVPKTLIAVSPYVGRVALAALQAGDDLPPAVKSFAETYLFSPSQIKGACKTVVLLHRKFGVAVLPAGADVQGKCGIRLFEHQRFEVVYMEGVMNILEVILRLHGARGTLGSPRESVVAILGHPDKLAATLAPLTAAENAINSPEATEKSEAFKTIFNFVKSGEQPRAMAAGEKDAIQTELTPFISTAVRQALADRGSNISHDQTDDFVRVLTSSELQDEAA